MSAYTMNVLTAIIVIIGAFNWGVVGISGINVVERICGLSIARIVYILVGISGLIQLILLVTDR